jgi:hypothetical protein
MKMISILLPILVSTNAYAWSGRGHHTVCDAASFLVKEKGLKEFLQLKPHVMGHLCNIPDIYWKDASSEIRSLGNPTHYINPEILGLSIADIPLDYKKIIHDFTGKKNQFREGTIFSIPGEFGSNWWRADQFFRRATSTNIKSLATPVNSKEEQDYKLPFNVAAYDFMVNLGIMGHFVGDNGQPFHSTADADGWATGNGGIHAFYEEMMVAAQSHSLADKVVQEAKRIQKFPPAFLKKESVLEKMRELSKISVEDIKKIKKIDPILKASQEKDEKGMKLREKAVRKEPSTAARFFEPVIIKNMARSAALLAQLWDMAYVKAGSPDLLKYRSYQHPFTPEFVAPDYFDTSAELNSKKD